jgi:hypothetical protein
MLRMQRPPIRIQQMASMRPNHLRKYAQRNTPAGDNNVPHPTTTQTILALWATTNILFAIAAHLRVRKERKHHTITSETIDIQHKIIDSITNDLDTARQRDQHNREALQRERELTDRTMLTIDSCLKNHTTPQETTLVFDATELRSALASDPRSAAANGEPFPYNPFDPR